MQERLAHSRQAFHFGLMLMLTPGILSAVAWPRWGVVLMTLSLAGAVLAIAARFWQQRLLKTARRGGGAVGFPLNLAGHTRLTSR
jgi:hypothetical protein